MSALYLRRRFAWVVVPCLAVLAWRLGMAGFPARAAQDGAPDLSKSAFYGAGYCKNCHVQPADRSTKLAYLNEYITWRTEDKHSLAYVVLEGPRGRQIGQLLGIDQTKDAMCLGCHTTSYRPGREGDKFSLKEGVSCDGCHGPAQHWAIPHAGQNRAWREKTPQEKERLGMFNLRDPVKRAQLCTSCHVGSAAEGKVITHAMYAAGHPPLPSFEVDNFSRNLPPHWRDLRDVPYFQESPPKVQKAYHFDTAEFEHTKLALASSCVGLDAAMKLLQNRAGFAAKPATASGDTLNKSWPPPWAFSTNDPKRLWPELKVGEKFNLPGEPAARWPEIVMAQADCYACHHDLKSPSWRQERGFPGKPGRPPCQAWPLALPDRLATDKGTLAQDRSRLYVAFDVQPFGKPDEVGRAAGKLAQFAPALTAPIAQVDRARAIALLHDLCSLPEKYYPDYDSARQIACAFRAIYLDSWNKSGSDSAKAKAVLQALDNGLNLTIDSSARAKLKDERRALIAAQTKNLREPEDIEKALSDRKFLDALQQLSERELQAALQSVSRYDPVTFRRHLSALAVTLPKQGSN
jgi:hypothetical protein